MLKAKYYGVSIFKYIKILIVLKKEEFMSKLLISPIKIQGKKTKLIEEINSSININLGCSNFWKQFLNLMINELHDLVQFYFN